MKLNPVTADQARTLLDYDPETGEFRWRARTPEMFVAKGQLSQETLCRMWNAKYAGQLTGESTYYPGYHRLGILGRIYLAHRVAWLISFGEWPKEDIDHVDGNRARNVLSNLREASRAQNLQNISAKSWREGKLVGASQIRKNGRWRATISANYEIFHLGTFDSELEAHQAYVEAKSRLHEFSPKLRAA